MNARVLISATSTGILLAACVSLAPGADKVHVTRKASDVANCTAVGNLKIPRDANGQVDLPNADTEFRNQTVGLGGNTAFVTSEIQGQGIGYRCP